MVRQQPINFLLNRSDMAHLDKLLAISLTTPMICTVFKNMSNWATSMNILQAIAAKVRSHVLPEFRTMTTA